MAVCLVTGGAGFIGSHLVEALVEDGHSVRVLDNCSTGNWDNLAGVRDRVKLFPGDITDPEKVREAMRGVELVFHQAALASVPRSIADPLATHEVCATGTLQVLLAAPRGQGAAGHLRGQLERVRRPGDFAQARERPDPAAVTLRRRQAGRRALLFHLLSRLRPGNGAAALLQRVWPATGAGQPLFGGDSPVYRGHARWRKSLDPRRRPAIARLYLCRGRGPGQLAGGQCRPRVRQGVQHCLRRPYHASRFGAADQREPGDCASNPPTTVPAPATCATVRPTFRRPRPILAFVPART